MDNQEKIFNKIKNASQKAEEKNFPAMEKVWMRVEEKLDKKEDKKAIALWKKLTIAASLLLFFSLGYQFIKTDSKVVKPSGTKENSVVIQEKTEPKQTEGLSKTIKPDAEVILKKQIEKPVIVVKTTTHINSNINQITSTNSEDIELSKDKEANINAFKVEAIALEENKGKAKITSTYDATTRMISGIVTDEQDLPLPGVNVYIKGITKGVATNFEGKFSIKAEKGDELVFSYIGYENSYATVGENDKINMKLVNNSMALNEVVVAAYASKPKKSVLTSSVAMISGTDLMKQKSANVSQALQGKIAGVQITNNPEYLSQDSPKPYPTIRIRGKASIRQSNEPLYIIDGVPVNPDEFKQLKPENIKTVNVLKDFAATSLYGSRASNGVILVTTKNGTYQNLSKKELEKRLKKLSKNKKQEQIVVPPKSIEVSQEDYENFVENQFESPKSAPLSTFSIDVDNASYTNIRRFINNGQTVPKDAVRVEEMMNFFKYKYPQPQDQNPFSINTEYSDCPWNPKHQLLKIGLQGKNIPTDNLPASNLVFLIDVSGSMSDPNKLPLLKQSLKILVNELRKKDKVAIVVYAGAAGMVLPPTSGDEKQTIIDALEKLNAGGSTAGGAGIELAYKLAEENFIKGGNNRVILATDGDFNVGASSNTDMQTLIEEKRKSGVFLTCLGYGMGNYKDSKMETLADKGNGNYAYIDNIQEANRFLGKEYKGSMFAIAKDVKIQIEFNPKHVQAYRLIGYENRKLRPEDFTNDTIDAGELGSGHTVTALYEVIPIGVENEFINNQPDLKYTKTSSNESDYSDELATIKFRYKKPDGDKSIEMVKAIENKSIPLKNSSDDFKFSSAVAWFGLKLRDSKLVSNTSSEEIKKLAKEGLSNDEDGYKAEFVRLVETVK
ncbi:Ca-activated chloride channel family protein [Flavobacterium tiangeerense]|uniref:Ca-activated chloride channel family protein n=1 Tax=Flavobacterium tiangeerense TaxID=459471 RepID=A0ABY3FN85_9FLAO|nr:VWA domain-containing protein [Flavobacterium tiangeerense]TWI03260.1 Ca-activated chloride channel family protein [Flavobacterium tiangeerense]